MAELDTLTGEITTWPDGKGPELTPVEREKMRADVAERDLQLAEDEIRKARRIIAALEAKLKKGYQEVPQAHAAKVIARYYTTRLKKDPKRWRFGDKRMQAVVARLREERDPEYICRAIDGLSIGSYVNPDNGMRYDDLELVCRDEVNLEKFYNLAEKAEAPTLLDQAWSDDLAGNLTPSEGGDTLCSAPEGSGACTDTTN